MIQTQAVNHAILTLKPIPSIPLLQQSSFSVPYLDAYSSICFRVRARIRGAAIFLLVVLVAAAPSESDIAEGQCGPQLCRRRGRCCFRPECRFRHPAPRKRDCGTPVSHLGLTHIGDQRQKAGGSMKLNKRFPPMNRRTESFLDGKA